MAAEESPVPVRSINDKSIPELAFEYMGDPSRALEDLRVILRVSFDVVDFIDIDNENFSRHGVYLREDCIEKGTWVRTSVYHVAAALKLAKEQAPEVFRTIDPTLVGNYSDVFECVFHADRSDLFCDYTFVTIRQKVNQMCREIEHEIHARQLTHMKTLLGGKSFPVELSVQLAARFIKNPPEIYEYLCRLVGDGLKLLEWKDFPGTDVTFTCLSDEATEEKVRHWFERQNGFISGIQLAVSRASAELRQYLTHRFIQADPEMWSVNGKKISDVEDVPDEVVWAMIQSHGIVPKRFWWGLSNLRAAMFRGLEQERGTAILVSDDPDALNDSFSDVVGFMSCLRDRLFLDDALNTELAMVSDMGAGGVGNATEPNVQSLVGKGRKLSLNAHMSNLMEKHKESCQSWSVERWQLELTPTWGKAPSKGGIHGTAIWKWLMSLREETQNTLQEKQTARDKFGKRRPTTF